MRTEKTGGSKNIKKLLQGKGRSGVLVGESSSEGQRCEWAWCAVRVCRRGVLRRGQRGGTGLQRGEVGAEHTARLGLTPRMGVCCPAAPWIDHAGTGARSHP